MPAPPPEPVPSLAVVALPVVGLPVVAVAVVVVTVLVKLVIPPVLLPVAPVVAEPSLPVEPVVPVSAPAVVVVAGWEPVVELPASEQAPSKRVELIRAVNERALIIGAVREIYRLRSPSGRVDTSPQFPES